MKKGNIWGSHPLPIYFSSSNHFLFIFDILMYISDLDGINLTDIEPVWHQSSLIGGLSPNVSYAPYLPRLGTAYELACITSTFGAEFVRFGLQSLISAITFR